MNLCLCVAVVIKFGDGYLVQLDLGDGRIIATGYVAETEEPPKVNDWYTFEGTFTKLPESVTSRLVLRRR